ncbi:MAG: carbohydrate-binding protein [Acidobacteria bacterium]|nr:carbohydrate-binding protein [Acidobacteriota bacterium]
MRKQIISPKIPPAAEKDWLDLESVAAVEVTSEDDRFPIESALTERGGRGWRAAGPGTQTIRLTFDRPQPLSQISLTFEEADIKRMQEFTLRWSSDGGRSFQEIVRQQWNFSSPDATREVENYHVDLPKVTVLELTIEPDKENKQAVASLLSLALCEPASRAL